MSRVENGRSDSSRSLKIQLAETVDLTQIFNFSYKHRNLKMTVWVFLTLKGAKTLLRSAESVLQGRFILKHKIYV